MLAEKNETLFKLSKSYLERFEKQDSRNTPHIVSAVESVPLSISEPVPSVFPSVTDIPDWVSVGVNVSDLSPPPNTLINRLGETCKMISEQINANSGENSSDQNGFIRN